MVACFCFFRSHFMWSSANAPSAGLWGLWQWCWWSVACQGRLDFAAVGVFTSVRAFRGLVRSSRSSWKRHRPAESASQAVASSSLHVFFSQKSECPSHVGLVAAMKQRIGAMFSRVPRSVPALGAGAAIGGFVLDAWKRRREEQDRARMVTRVIHSSFHAFQPKVEIPREQVQARCHAQVVSIRVALSFTLLC